MRRSEVEKVGNWEAGKVKRKAVRKVVDLRIKAKGQRIKDKGFNSEKYFIDYRCFLLL